MPARVRSGDEPFPDRSEAHALEVVELRLKMAAIVKIAFTLLAILLALGAVLVALGQYVTPTNVLVRSLWHVDDVFDGPFSRHGGVFTFTGHNARKLDAVVNWGLVAVIYMVIGNVLRGLLAPRETRRD